MKKEIKEEKPRPSYYDPTHYVDEDGNIKLITDDDYYEAYNTGRGADA